MSARYASENGLVLDDKLKLRDEGVSAYDKSNIDSGGKLGEFLNAVKTGQVLAGSYLLVESLDRISRARIKEAMSLFNSIVDSGITIVTLSDGMKYSPTDDASKDLTNMFMSLFVMARAHEESAMKSMRLKESEMYDFKLISPTTADKLAKAGTIGPRQWPKLQALITQSTGKPHVAPESDPRPALVLTAVADEFENVAEPSAQDFA